MRKFFKILSLFLIESLVFQSIALCSDDFANDIKGCVPPKYGTLRQVKANSNSDKWIIHIQDAHCNFDAQRNISNILKRLSNKGLLDQILVEGSKGKIDPAPIRSYPDAQSKINVSDYLLKSASISGAEYFAVCSDKDIPVYGIENEREYQQNLKALRFLIGSKDDNNRIINDFLSLAQNYKQSIYSPEILEFDKNQSDYKSHKLPLDKYIQFLTSKVGVSSEFCPYAFKFLELNTLSKKINFSLLEKETMSVFNSLSAVLPKEKLNALFKLNLAFKMDEAAPSVFYGDLISMANSAKIDTGGFKNLSLYSRVVTDYNLVSQEGLYSDIVKLENAYLDKFLSSGKEKNLFDFSYRVNLLKDFFNLSLSKIDKEYIMSNPGFFSAKEIGGLIESVYGDSNLKISEADKLKLESNITQSMEFYKIAGIRDGILVGNAIKEMSGKNSKYSVLVSGGFHTDSICRLLEDKNVNYAVIIPKINDAESSGLYLSAMSHPLTKFDKFIETAVNSLADSSWLAENPIGFDPVRKQVKIAQAVSLLLAESADNIYLKGGLPDTSSILSAINKMIAGYDSGNVEITDFKILNGYRFYKMSINGREMFYYFDNIDSEPSKIKDLILSDVDSILSKEIVLGNQKSVTAMTTGILNVLGPEFEKFETALKRNEVSLPDQAKNGRSGVQIKAFIMDYAFLRGGFKLQNMLNELRIKTRADFDFYADIDPLIKKMLEDKIIVGDYNGNNASFKLSEDARLAYYLTIMSENKNFFPNIEELSQFDISSFQKKGILGISIEGNIPFDAVLALIRGFKDASGKVTADKPLNVNLGDGSSYEAMVLSHAEGYKYFRVISSLSKRGLESGIEPFEESLFGEQDTRAGAMIGFSQADNAVLAISKDGGFYNISLIEVGGEKRFEQVLFEQSVPAGNEAKVNISLFIQQMIGKYSPYVSLLGIIILSDDKVKILNPNEINRDTVDGALFNDDISGLLINEVNQLNEFTANQSRGVALESLSAILDENMDEKSILGKLSVYTSNALIEIAKTTRNPAYLRVLAKNDIYSMPDSKIKAGDPAINRIKEELITNQFTPVDSLMDLLKDTLFLDHLIQKIPDKFNALINHSHAMPELIRLAADSLSSTEWQVDRGMVSRAVFDKFKQAIISSPFSNEVILIQYFNDPSINVRIALGKSTVSDIMADDPDDDVKLETAKNPNTSLTFLYRFAEPSSNVRIKMALASNIMIDKRIVDMLLVHGDEDVKVVLANTLANGNLPMFKNNTALIEQYLLRLIDECGDVVDAAVAMAKNKLSVNILSKLILQGPKIRVIVANRQDLTPDIITELYSTSGDDTRQRLVLNPSVDLPSSEYNKAIQRSKTEKYGWRVREAIAKKHKLSPAVMAELLKDQNIKVRAVLAQRADLPEEIANSLADDINPFVRGSLAGNPNIKFAALKPLSNDQAYLYEGLIDKNGVPVEGFDRNFIEPLKKSGDTVLTLLSSNKKILNDPLLTDRLMMDYKYHSHVLKMINNQRESASEAYAKGDYHGVYNILKNLADSKYVPFGTLFELGNSFYMMRDYEKAKKYYLKSFLEMNDVNSFLASRFLERDGVIPDIILKMSVPIQTVLQNFHNAQPIGEESIEQVIGFLNFINSSVPDNLVPPNISVPVKWGDLFYYENYENMAAIYLYALRDVIGRGFLQVSDALLIYSNLLSKFSDPSKIGENWNDIRAEFWKSVISKSNVNDKIKKQFMQGEPELVEFFLRSGVRGIIKYNEYITYRNGIIMDNVPSFLRDDLAKSVWVEFIDLTEDLLFSEPEYFKRLVLVKQHGAFGGVDNALKISLSLYGGRFRYGVGDVDSVVRSEGAHSITGGIFHNIGMFRDVDELQDRSSALRFPKDLDNPDKAKLITDTYSEHDKLMITLYNLIASKYSIEDLMLSLKNFKVDNIAQDYAIRNALVGLKDNNNPMAKRILGEAFFYLYQFEPNLTVIDKGLPSIIERLTSLKEAISKFPWDVKIFFDGGCYLATYQQPFPVVAPPLDVILGTEVINKMSKNVSDEHYSGEWLHYLLRMRVRQLLDEGKLTPSNLHRFYKTAVVYLSSVTRNGELFLDLDSIINDFKSRNPGLAMMKALYMFNDNQLRGLPEELQSDLRKIRSFASYNVKYDKNKLVTLADQSVLDQKISKSDDFYPIAVSYLTHISTRISMGRDIDAATLTASLAGKLLSRGNKDYAMELASVFLPVSRDIENAMLSEINAFISKYAENKKNSASSLKGIVDFIFELTPQQVIDPIVNRNVLGSEPEKVVLKEVGRQIADNLFFAGEIGLGELSVLIADYYAKTYKDYQASQTGVNVLNYAPFSSGLFNLVQSHIIPFLSNYSFVNVRKMLDNVKAKFNEASKRGGNAPAGSVLYTHWSSVVIPFFIGGVTLKSLAVGIIGILGIAAGIYLTFKLVKFAFSKIADKSKSSEDIDIRPMRRPSWIDDISAGNVRVEDIVPNVRFADSIGKQVVLVDFDNLFNTWDSLSAFKYFISDERFYQGSKIFVYSAKYPKHVISERLKSAGISAEDSKKLYFQIVSSDEVDGKEGFDLFSFLKINYNILPSSLILLTKPDSFIEKSFLPYGAVSFNLNDEDGYDLTGLFEKMSLVIEYYNSGNLPEKMEITGMKKNNPYYNWFTEMKNTKKRLTVRDLAAIIKANGKAPNLLYLIGVSFGLGDVDSKNRFSHKTKWAYQPALIDSAM